MQKIFKAMEMIATSRINKARRSAQTTGPYANALTRVVTALATQQSVQHPLIHRPDTFGKHEHKRSAVLVMTSDRGLAGSYSSSVLKKTEELIERLRGEGREIQLYLVGRKAKSYFEFRERPYERAWEGHTDNPHIDTAVEIRDVFLEEYEKGHENGGGDDNGHKGYLIMSNNWFNDFFFRLVVDKQYVSADIQKMAAQAPIMLSYDDPVFAGDL